MSAFVLIQACIDLSSQCTQDDLRLVMLIAYKWFTSCSKDLEMKLCVVDPMAD